MQKAKDYDWKDSNLALFGSDTEKQVKKESAESEPAWQGAGQKVGVQIWRIVKFQVTHWPKEEYGKFFDGDSYIILNTYQEKDSEELNYDVHFWIGKHSTQDEYGTAAYKTVELDTFLDDKPVQHREVQDHESSLFKSYFRSIMILEGGAETGFKHVEPKKYEPRLFRCTKGKGRKGTFLTKQVSFKKKLVTSGDVFILDAGLKMYQWNGKDSNADEKYKSAQFFNELTGLRPLAAKETVDEEDMPGSHEFWTYFNDDDDESDGVEDNGEQAEEDDTNTFEKVLFRLSNASGELTFTEIGSGSNISISDLDSSDVFILDVGTEVFVWVGSGADAEEKRNGIPYAEQYLRKTRHRLAGVTCLRQGQRCRAFESCLS